ncbi:lipopolysaccharide biosynthesis protein [Leuconostoc lactis]|uniref:lipopolysaccharide biosynthesis protein n=1 Tax=Leuconostoc lactis TaxID=1246 RepID=UPI003745699B
MNQRKSGAILAYINIFLKNSINLIYTPFLLRFLGHAEFGLYQLTIQVVSTLSILALGFSGAYVRFYWKFKKEDSTKIQSLNGLYLIIYSIISIFSFVIGSLLILLVPIFFGNTFTQHEIEVTKILFLIMICNIALTFLSTVFDSYIIANQQFKFQQTRALLGTILQPILTIPMLFLGFKAIAVLSVQTTITIIFLLVNVRFALFRLDMKFKFKEFPNGLMRNLFIFSSFLLVNDLVDLVNNNVPSLIIGSFVGAQAIAVYGIAIQIRTMFIQLSLALSNVFIPKINEIVNFKNSNNELLALMIKVGRFQLLILSTIYFGFVILGEYFLKLWAGNGFQDAYWMILLMIFPVLVPLSQNLGIEIQRAKNMHQFRSYVLGILAFFNLIITVYTVKEFGVVGAVFGYIFSIGVGNGLMINLYNHKKVGLNMIKYWRGVVKMLLPGIISMGVVSFFKIYVPIKNVGVFIGYGCFYLIIVGFVSWKYILNSNEKKLIFGRLSKKGQ